VPAARGVAGKAAARRRVCWRSSSIDINIFFYIYLFIFSSADAGDGVCPLHEAWLGLLMRAVDCDGAPGL